jgi:uncharacterized protein DUF1844
MPEKDRPDRKEEEESTGFKVTDRRLFTPGGERREGVEPPPGEPEATPPPPPRAKAAAEQPFSGRRADSAPASGPISGQDAPGGQTRPERQGPVSFEHLVMSLATTAMFQLGLVKSHEGDNPRIDLVSAKETIDLLDILQQKTRGNLTEEEEGLIEGSLYELRMVFVELSKAGRGR